MKVTKDNKDYMKKLTVNEIQDILDNKYNDINISGDEVKVVMLPPDEPDDQDSAGDSEN